MSRIGRYSDFTPTPSAKHERTLTRTLGCGVEELVAQLGTKAAIKCVESELRRAKSARSRKLYAFWSAVLIRIESKTDDAPNTAAREASMAAWGRDAPA
jgi:hypothetical protein